MKKLLISLMMIFLSPVTSAFSQAELISLLQKPENTQGNFIQKRFLQALNTPITTSGEFFLVKNLGLIWKMKIPFETTLRVKKDGISQWNNTQWIQTSMTEKPEQIALFLGLLSGDITKLEQNFDLSLEGASHQWELTLTPNNLLMKQIFKKINIMGSNTVETIILDETQGDKTLINFKNIKINQPIPDVIQSALQ